MRTYSRALLNLLVAMVVHGDSTVLPEGDFAFDPSKHTEAHGQPSLAPGTLVFAVMPRVADRLMTVYKAN